MLSHHLSAPSLKEISKWKHKITLWNWYAHIGLKIYIFSILLLPSIQFYCFQIYVIRRNTAQNTVISLNFMVRKFCGKAQFPHSFGRICLVVVLRKIIRYVQAQMETEQRKCSFPAQKLKFSLMSMLKFSYNWRFALMYLTNLWRTSSFFDHCFS